MAGDGTKATSITPCTTCEHKFSFPPGGPGSTTGTAGTASRGIAIPEPVKIGAAIYPFMSTGVATSATMGSSSTTVGTTSDATVKNDCKIPATDINKTVHNKRYR